MSQIKEIEKDLPLLGNTLRFFGENCKNPKGFMNFLHKPEFFPLVQFTLDFHKDDRRKITGDPYFKHLFYTAYLCFESSENSEYSDSEKRIFIGGALLHDAIEIRRKKKDFGQINLFNLIKPECFNEEEARRITTISSLLTPFFKPKKLTEKEKWLKIKLTDFTNIISTKDYEVLRKYNKLFPHNTISIETAKRLAEMIKQIKIADEAANLRETADDVKTGRDKIGEKPNGIMELDWRAEDFRNRLIIIKEQQPNNPLLSQILEDLHFLQDSLLPS